MNRIQEALAQLGYEQFPHVRHKHDLLQTIRHFASAASDAELVSQAGDEIKRLISRSTLAPGTLKAGSIQPVCWQSADWCKLGRFHVMNAYGRSACGGGMDLIEHEAIDATLVPDANRCRRVGCKDIWPTEGAIAASLNIEQLENLLGELYQVLGALDAPEAVLDQVVAALEGGPLPNESLLPFVVQE
jgi:hypothetical protein